MNQKLLLSFHFFFFWNKCLHHKINAKAGYKSDSSCCRGWSNDKPNGAGRVLLKYVLKTHCRLLTLMAGWSSKLGGPPMIRITGAGREAVAHLQQQQRGGSQTSNHKSAATTNFQLAAGDWVKMSVLCVSFSPSVCLYKWSPKGKCNPPLQSDKYITPLNMSAWAQSCLRRNTSKSIISTLVILQGVWHGLSYQRRWRFVVLTQTVDLCVCVFDGALHLAEKHRRWITPEHQLNCTITLQIAGFNGVNLSG